MSTKPEDALLGAASKNEGLQSYAIENKMLSGNELSSGQDEAKNEAREEMYGMAGAVVAASFGLPPELGEKVGKMVAQKQEEKEEEEKNKEGKEKSSFRVPSLGIGG